MPWNQCEHWFWLVQRIKWKAKTLYKTGQKMPDFNRLENQRFKI